MFVNPQPFLSFFPPSSYPDDPPLFFEEFPEHDDWIYADTMTEDEKRTLNEIKYSKFSLGITKENAKDRMTYQFGVAPGQMTKCEAIPDLPGPVGCVLPNPIKVTCYIKLVVQFTWVYTLLRVVYWGSKIA